MFTRLTLAQLFTVLFILAPLQAQGQEADSKSLERYLFPPSVVFSVLDAPSKATVQGRDVLCYELMITNLEARDCKVERLQALHQDSVLYELDGESLSTNFRHLDLSHALLGNNLIPAGKTVFAYLWLEPEGPVDSLRHRLLVSFEGVPFELEGAPTEVQQEAPISVSLPFSRPGRWAAIGAPSNTAGHRVSAIPVDGRLWISQRFAIDWVLLGPDDEMAKGDGSKNEDHYCYAAEALAVADGVVVGVYDGLVENVPSPDQRAVPINLETVGGNWVALEIAPKRYAMYAHLIPKSIKVKKGDRVRKGQVVGLVGNTGNSTAPHLHFHISATPHWIASEGLPYRIERYTSVGTMVEDESEPKGYKIVSKPDSDSLRLNDLPGEGEIVLVKP